MTNAYPHALSPIQLGDTVFRNRIFASPVSLPDYSNDAGMTVRQKMFYAERARGGAASVSTGDGIVDFETGFVHPYKLRLDDREIYPALSDLTRTVRQYGAIPTLELSHGGKYANVSNLIGNMQRSRKAYGPMHEFTADGEEIFEMPRDMIASIAAAYGRAAALGKEAGFGMMLIHAGHGWLLNQFMSPANNRADEFGGSFENRMRFPRMVIEAVRAAVGPGFPIEFRMSGAEFTEQGYDVEYGVRIAQAIDGKVDLIHVSAGVHDCKRTFIITHPSMFRDHGCNVFLAARIKQAVRTPVATIGALTDPDMLEDIIASGKADVVELGRQLLADPELPVKMMEGREADIVHCMRCFTCMEQLPHRRSMRCALNPRIGREDEPPLARADRPKTVLIAGGGPAGMEAALAARARGHRVTLFEASDRLGGKPLCERDIPFKRDMYRFAATLAGRVARAGIEVRLNTALTPELAEALHPDAIIAATGAAPVRLPIPGADRANVFTCMDLRDGFAPGQTVAIIGGGLVGCESAVHFAAAGRQVTLLELLDDVARDATWPHRLALLEQLEASPNIRLLTGVTATAVTEDGVAAVTRDGTACVIPAESVMMAAGLRPLRAQAEALRGAAPRFAVVGDAQKPDQLFAAVSGGWYAGAAL